MDKLKIYYLSGTHWDREWYQSFQGFRYRLVNMMNEMVDVLENDENFKTYHFDGQTIVLEDYKEIEPEKSEKFRDLITDGRVIVGPWYVMPDEFLLSGESLIRNLMIGHKISKEWGGEPWKYGYICDIFGHIAQMPQIFNGFDIKYALLGRGTNEHNCPAHFIWQSPNGSECITFKVPDGNGYGAFSVEALGYLSAEKPKTKEELKERIKKFIDYEISRTDIPFVVITDAIDHTPIHPETTKCMELIKELYPNAEVYHENMVNMGEQLEEYRGKMPIKKGELNETAKAQGGFIHLITHTLSSRYPIKKDNDECQNLLEKWIEPIMVISKLNGKTMQRNYVDMAYKYLIQNHPHDSICGCSIDQVHKDMEYRFDQTKMICNQLLEDFLNDERAGEEKGDLHNRVVTIWNVLPFARKEAITIDINFEKDYLTKYAEPFGYEYMNSFKIYDYKNNEVPYKLVSMQKDYCLRIFDQQVETVDKHKITFEAEMPAMGKAQYKVVPCEKPSRYLEVLSKDSNKAENDFVELTINENGTVNLLDKETGNLYSNLISYIDDGEIGDGWYHVNPVEDRVVSSISTPCIIEKVENGPSRTVFKVTQNMQVPAYLDYNKHGIRRSCEMTTLEILSFIGLSKNTKYVDVETTVNNTAKNHRLRLKLPTNIKSDSYFASQQFCFIERSVGVKTETADWKECDLFEKQMSGIVGKRNADGSGLAFVSPYGLHECAGMDDSFGSLIVTLFRSFNKTVMTNGEKTGQVQGKMSFKYALMPIDTQTTYADMIRTQDCLSAGVKTVDFRVGNDYELVKPQSYFELTGKNICMSILKCAEDKANNNVVIRLFNMSDTQAECSLKCFKDINEASFVSMNEEFMSKGDFNNNIANITLGAWEIITLSIQF